MSPPKSLGRNLPRSPKRGRCRSFRARPGIDQLRGRPLVIAATEDDEEDARVSAIARALGVPVNVPDRPELCTFALPAIVDRGEVTVAIGTSGASPVLAQRLRAWLEQELHPRLDALAKLAAEFRGPVAEKLPSGRPRRKFWEAVFEGAAAEAMLEGDEDKARALIGAAIERGCGKAGLARPRAVGRRRPRRSRAAHHEGGARAESPPTSFFTTGWSARACSIMPAARPS